MADNDQIQALALLTASSAPTRLALAMLPADLPSRPAAPGC
jgi:hypothetical protein